MVFHCKSGHMDIKESQLSKDLGIPRSEFKNIRNAIKDKHDLGVLWYREESKKPEHMRSIWWTDVGVYYLRTYLQVKVQWEEETKVPIDMKVLSKDEFNKTVNDTKWIGKIVRNGYKNRRLLMVEHDIGYRCIVNCKNNSDYSLNSFVVVDSKNFNHYIRKPAYKSYEKALKDCKREQRPS